MTTLIQQKSEKDCTLAAIAMATGKSSWEDLWTPEDLAAVITSQGISDIEPWLKRASLRKYTDYFEVYASHERVLKAMLWKRRAILSIDSLNTVGGHHSVYWDGDRIYDPQEGRAEKLYHKILTGCSITRVVIFAAP